MMQLWNNIKLYIITLIAILALIFAGYQWWQLKNITELTQQYKQELLDRDQLIKVQDGQYKKLVEDTYTQRELMKEIKEQNKQLHQSIKDQQKQIVALIALQQSFTKKTDTVYVNKDQSFTDYYPDKDQWFIKYQSTVVSDSTRVGDWDFGKMNIDLVITEKQTGLFEVDVSGPSYIEVTSLEVKSIPLEEISPDNFGWLLGGSMQYNLIDSSPQIDVYGGFRYKKSNWFVKATTQGAVGAGMFQEF